MRFLQIQLDWLVGGRSPTVSHKRAWAVSQEEGGIPLTHTRQRWWFAQGRSHPSNIRPTPIRSCIATKLRIKPEQRMDKARSHLGQAREGRKQLDGATHAWCRYEGHLPGSVWPALSKALTKPVSIAQTYTGKLKWFQKKFKPSPFYEVFPKHEV